MYIWNLHYYESALDYNTRALEVRRRFFGELHPEVAESYRMVGRTYWYMSDRDLAVLYFKKAMETSRSLWGEYNPLNAVIHTNLGMVYQRQYDIALDQFRKAQRMGTPFWGEKHLDAANLFYCFGLVFLESGKRDSAFPYIQKSLNIRREILGEDHFEVAASYDLLGSYYRTIGRFDLAVKYHRKYLNTNLRFFDMHHPWVSNSYSHLAETYRAQGNFDSALKYRDRSLELLVKAQSSDNLNSNPLFKEVRRLFQLWSSLRQKAETLQERYNLQSNDLKDLERALLTYKFFSQVADEVRSRFRSEGSKYYIGEIGSPNYENAIRIARSLFRETRDQHYLYDAFFFAEKSKSPVLLQSVSEARAMESSAIPDSLLDREYRLRTELAYCEQKLFEDQNDSVKVVNWRDRRFKTQESLVNLQRRLERDFPEYLKLKSQIEVASVEQVQHDLLDENTTLLEYVIADDSLFIFVVSRDGLEVEVVPKSPSLGMEIERLRESIVVKDFGDYVQSAHELYRQLIAPVAESLQMKDLIIVPDGELNMVPFEALLTRPVSSMGAEEDYSCLPYLVNNHSISYAYSATLLHETQMGRRVLPKNDYVAFAPIFKDGIPTKTRGYQFFQQNAGAASAVRLTGQLLHSEKEAVGILELFTRTYGFLQRRLGNKSHVYLGNTATEHNFKNLDLLVYRYLHLATHGFSNDENPELSGLVLAQEKDSQEDNVLRLNEIKNLKLSAELVVLSACETALGKMITGEGIIGLVRGFLNAGAQNLLVSQWQVSDAATAKLMIEFYANMLSGASKADAIREAKLTLMRSNSEYAKPYYWSAFVLIGR
jgi:CHAT domain-containing protein